ncbi:Abi-alpha family protein [Mycobacterium hubeiense]|uniref:Abi-alpha family protein n=1 Tax=Mycobacterium hubeiense TaxID=1867256 RepID=UPI000C7EA335|nr:Abi-alpha family protein [Mycobacterium sp. QGD 101]
MTNFFDRLHVVERTAEVARFWLNVTSWTEEQLRHRLDEISPPASTPTSAPVDAPQPAPAEQSLSAKMSRLLDRALDQSTRGGQVELFHRILDQLVADEARIICALSDGSASPLVNVHAWTRPRVPGSAVLENASLIGRTANLALPAMVPTYVGHLLSLGLLETGPEDPEMKTDYEVLMAETMVLEAIKRASRGPLTAKVEKLTLRLSGLGQSLWAATMQEDSS